MYTIDFVTYVTDETDLDWSHITDLAVRTVGGSDYLISATRHDGVLRSWSIDDGPLSTRDTLAFEGTNLPGGTTTIMGIGPNLLVGGGTDGALQTIEINTDGSFGSVTPTVVLPDDAGGLQYGTTITRDDGGYLVYGSHPEQDGLFRLSVASDGSIINYNAINDPTALYGDQITATTAVSSGGQTYIFSASSVDNGMTGWLVDVNGDLSVVENIGNDDGLWVTAPTAMEVATVGSETYVILGAAGSGTLTVMQVAPDGSLSIRDHLLDTLDTRFGGVTAIEIVIYGDQTYVIAGGADDGLSVFMLLEGGYLLPRAHIADTTDMGVDNVSAIATRSDANGIDIFVASSSEVGITHLRYDPGPIGQSLTATLAGGMLSGTNGNDIIQGHDGDDVLAGDAGNDIIRDGFGSDTMTGGAGADVFILSPDGLTDTITDFTVGEDMLDLSLWPMLRDISQLTISLQTYGMDIRYGDELLIVQSSDGQVIDYRLLENGDLIGGSRMSQIIEPGYPGPATPPPDDTPPETTPIDQDGPNSLTAGLASLTSTNLSDLATAVAGSTAGDSNVPSSGDDVLIGDDRNDQLFGGEGIDVIMGGAGDDLLSGGDGADILLGRAGRDEISGGDGADVIHGGHDNDILDGGNGQDVLNGGAGDDVIAGGAGDDLLFGGDGADSFIFNGGKDVITDFAQGIDLIQLDATLWTGLTSAEDVLFFYGSIDGTRATIELDDGSILHIDGVLDFATFSQDIDLF